MNWEITKHGAICSRSNEIPPSPPEAVKNIGSRSLVVIPAEAGIQYFNGKTILDSGFHRVTAKR